MKFAGFDFEGLTTPFDISYTPAGWAERLSVSVSRSTAKARTELFPDKKPWIKQLTPMALESRTTLPRSLPPSQVITSLVTAASAAGGGVTKSTSAAELPDVLSQRPRVLEYGNMNGVLCAGFMIATFQYDFLDAPTAPATRTPGNADNQEQWKKYYEDRKQASAQDAVVGTAFNLAKSKGSTVVHARDKRTRDNQTDQVHTEQLLCGQIDAFMDSLAANAANAKVVNVFERWVFKKDGFDMKKMAVRVKIVFEHHESNVTVDCDACSKTIEKTTAKWSGKCKAFTVTVSKNA